MQVDVAESAGSARRRAGARVTITLVLVGIAVVVPLLLAGVALTPRLNAVIALAVFGGVPVVIVGQRRLVRGRRAHRTMDAP